MMMNPDFENALFHFLRTRTEPFTLKDALTSLGPAAKGCRQKDVKQFLSVVRLTFSLPESKTYLSRSALFNGACFSIYPSKFEVQSGVMIIGHRCIGICDPEVLPQEITFVCDDDSTQQTIVKTPFSISSTDVYSYYSLFGDEYVYQFLAMDNPQNNHDFIKSGFEMPPFIKITVLDMKDLYKKWNFSYGDRLLARMENWDASIVHLEPLCRPNENPFYCDDSTENREKWLRDIETSFLESFKHTGPVSSVEEQVASAFFIGRDVLFSRDCASIEEFMQVTKKVDFADYGVESRLWYTDEEIPLMGEWTKNSCDTDIDDNSVFFDAGIPVTEVIIESFLRDSLYRKEESCTALVERIFPDLAHLSKHQASLLSVHVFMQRNSIEDTYNWFSDYVSGKLRSCMLDLYVEISRFICDLDIWKIDPEDLPQQSFVILSQLIGHITGLLDSLNVEKVIDKDEEMSLYASLEGMKEGFAETKAVIVSAVKDLNKSRFSVISHIKKSKGEK